MSKITSTYPQLVEALQGIGVDTDSCRRVVIDIQVGELPAVYVEYLGTKELVEVVGSLGETVIRVANAEVADAFPAV